MPLARRHLFTAFLVASSTGGNVGARARSLRPTGSCQDESPCAHTCLLKLSSLALALARPSSSSQLQPTPSLYKLSQGHKGKRRPPLTAVPQALWAAAVRLFPPTVWRGSLRPNQAMPGRARSRDPTPEPTPLGVCLGRDWARPRHERDRGVGAAGPSALLTKGWQSPHHLETHGKWVTPSGACQNPQPLRARTALGPGLGNDDDFGKTRHEALSTPLAPDTFTKAGHGGGNRNKGLLPPINFIFLPPINFIFKLLRSSASSGRFGAPSKADQYLTSPVPPGSQGQGRGRSHSPGPSRSRSALSSTDRGPRKPEQLLVQQCYSQAADGRSVVTLAAQGKAAATEAAMGPGQASIEAKASLERCNVHARIQVRRGLEEWRAALQGPPRG
ncbi:uncharacterized protein BKCO1_1100079 [Diplodia corticola]|uniref:Uncharacterized protein n=1 Tax=Diplodia corticola TaxID=236234 RepID=A0A1J9S924_9PEZI|nr:uncharacterized protein BKCO1_1100079 [Diplodia corticola]OJD36404.1 hypothetical protein BKCO1_1100079 [Diplodia corticola]